jgi:hypothetical protein
MEMGGEVRKMQEIIGIWFLLGLFVGCFILSFIVAMSSERLRLITFAAYSTVISGIGLIAMFIFLGFLYSVH